MTRRDSRSGNLRRRTRKRALRGDLPAYNRTMADLPWESPRPFRRDETFGILTYSNLRQVIPNLEELTDEIGRPGFMELLHYLGWTIPAGSPQWEKLVLERLYSEERGWLQSHAEKETPNFHKGDWWETMTEAEYLRYLEGELVKIGKVQSPRITWDLDN